MKNLKLYEEINEDERAKGLLVFVYKSELGDATANGLTSKEGKLILMGEELDGPFTPKEEVDYLVVQKKGDYIYCVPKSILDSKEWAMFGGNFVYTSDSRFAKISKYPIPVHDRVEKYRG